MSEPNNTGMPEINIEAIMEEIRAQIKEDKAAGRDPAFDDIERSAAFEPNVSYDAYICSLQHINTRSDVPVYVVVGGGVKGFVKRVIRKINSIMLKPMNILQNELNACNANCHNYAYQTLEDLKEEVRRLSVRVDTLTKENEELKKRL